MSDAEIKTDDELKTAECIEGSAPKVRLKVGEPAPEFDQAVAIQSFMALPESQDHVAMPINDFYWARMTSCLLDFLFAMFSAYLVSFVSVTLAIAAIVIFPRAILDSNLFTSVISAIQVVVWLTAFIGFKTFRGLKDYTSTGLKVVDKNGNQITFRRALGRAVLFMISIWLFPIYLVYLAAGSRRLIHDQLSGTYVIETGENLRTTFYPPVPRWIPLLLIVTCISAVCCAKGVKEQYEKVEVAVVPALFGRESPLYLAYLKAKLNPRNSDVDGLSEVDSRRLLSIYVDLSTLQRSRQEAPVEETVLFDYTTALVAAKAGQDGTAMEHIMRIAAYPLSLDKKALGAQIAGIERYYPYPNLFGAAFLMRNGYAQRARVIAQVEKEISEKTLDKEHYVLSSTLIVECLHEAQSGFHFYHGKTLEELKEAERRKIQEYETLIKSEEAEREQTVKRLK